MEHAPFSSMIFPLKPTFIVAFHIPQIDPNGSLSSFRQWQCHCLMCESIKSSTLIETNPLEMWFFDSYVIGHMCHPSDMLDVLSLVFLHSAHSADVIWVRRCRGSTWAACVMARPSGNPRRCWGAKSTQCHTMRSFAQMATMWVDGGPLQPDGELNQLNLWVDCDGKLLQAANDDFCWLSKIDHERSRERGI